MDILKNIFGVIGEELHEHANGKDLSEISTAKNLDKDKSLSVGETLYRNFKCNELDLIIKDAVENLGVRLRKHKKIANNLYLRLLLNLQRYNNSFRHT